MQGEAVMLFWGNEQVLWLAVAGVMIISLLLIRVGIAHFQREYLLGREIDVINLRWMWHTFWRNFIGGAHFRWRMVSECFGLRHAADCACHSGCDLIAGVSLWMGYDWIMVNVSQVIAKASPERSGKD